MAELKYIYDQDGGISPYPSSPFLLPALVIFGAGKFINWLFSSKSTFWRHVPNVSLEEYRHNRKIYLKLQESWRLNGKWTIEEYLQNDYIGQPSWALPGEHWSYENDL